MVQKIDDPFDMTSNKEDYVKYAKTFIYLLNVMKEK